MSRCSRGANATFGSRALNIALDFDLLEAGGLSTALAADALRSRNGLYDPELLEAFAALRGRASQTWEVKELALNEVEVGMSFAEDVRSQTGALLIPRGYEVTPSVLARIRNLSAGAAAGPVRVVIKLDAGIAEIA